MPIPKELLEELALQARLNLIRRPGGAVDLGPDVLALIADRAEIIELLRAIEWSTGQCPACFAARAAGHASACRLLQYLAVS